MPLICETSYLSAQIGNKNVRVEKISKECMEAIDELNQRGYALKKAFVWFIVAWKG